MELQLFRIKVFGPRNPSLFDPLFTPSAAIRRSIEQRPTSRPRRGVRWHIGNVEAIDEDGYYFRIGRQSRASLPQLDQESGNFVESEFESAPYTHALLDATLEVCAIAPKFSLAPSADSISRRLVNVLNENDENQDPRATYAVSALSDPDEFIALLQSAHIIRSYTFTYQRRNPFDANEMFIQPFERLVEATRATEGHTTVKGAELDEVPLEQITRSAAATGDDAAARLVLNPDALPVTRHLRGNNVGIPAAALDDTPSRLAALVRLC